MTKLAINVTAADRVYEEILRLIAKRSLKAGERLPEASLAREMNVSRTPVREALHRLEREGIVILIAGGGARLAAPTMQEINDTMEIRIYLEHLVVTKLARTITPLQFHRLDEALSHEEDPDRSLPDLLKGDSAFHHLLAESTGNSALIDSLDALLVRSTAYRMLFADLKNYDNHLIAEEHKEILEALQAHDPELAAERLHSHLEIAATELARTAQSPPKE